MSLHATAPTQPAQPHAFSTAVRAVRQVTARFMRSPMAMAGLVFVMVAALLSIGVR